MVVGRGSEDYHPCFYSCNVSYPSIFVVVIFPMSRAWQFIFCVLLLFFFLLMVVVVFSFFLSIPTVDSFFFSHFDY